MTDKQYDDAILDSNAIDPTDVDGNPIPVTIPIMLAPGVKVIYTTRLGGTSEGDYAHCNLGGKTGDDPNHVLANRVALSSAIDAKLSLVSQVHSGVAVDVDESFVMNRPFGFDASGSKGETAQQVGETADNPAVVEADGQRQRSHPVSFRRRGIGGNLPVRWRRRTAARGTFQEDSP